MDRRLCHEKKGDCHKADPCRCDQDDVGGESQSRCPANDSPPYVHEHNEPDRAKVAQNSENHIDRHISAKTFETVVIQPQPGCAKRRYAVEKGRPCRGLDAGVGEGEKQSRCSGQFRNQGERDDTSDELIDSEVLRHAEDGFADLPAALRENGAAREDDERPERHVTKPADLDQHQDDDLPQEVVISADTDGYQSGR